MGSRISHCGKTGCIPTLSASFPGSVKQCQALQAPPCSGRWCWESDSHWRSLWSSGQELYWPERIEPALNSTAKNRGHQNSWQPAASSVLSGKALSIKARRICVSVTSSLHCSPEPFPHNIPLCPLQHTAEFSNSHCFCIPQILLNVP